MEKFVNPKITAKGDLRASVHLKELKTLWFNTGTLCNLSCENCYIESSPKNDRLVYLNSDDVKSYLDEKSIASVQLIGITGGEPFLNPNIIAILELILKRGFEALVLTNAVRVLKRHKPQLIKFNNEYPYKLNLRVSLDHYSKEVHEKERGVGSFDKALEEINWLVENKFNVSIAGRSLMNEDLLESRAKYQQLFDSLDIDFKISDENFVIFPEMDLQKDVPEITTECWGILNKSPDDQMCASERMIIKRKGDEQATVVPCTLLAYDTQFDLGRELDSAKKDVYLNHKFCATFCVLGGASCSSAK